MKPLACLLDERIRRYRRKISASHQLSLQLIGELHSGNEWRLCRYPLLLQYLTASISLVERAAHLVEHDWNSVHLSGLRRIINLNFGEEIGLNEGGELRLRQLTSVGTRSGRQQNNEDQCEQSQKKNNN